MSNKWVELSTSSAPTATRNMAMTFDATRSEIVLFGGVLGAAEQSETWTFDGSDWTELTPVTTPSARTGPRMVDTGSTLLMYGGFDFPSAKSDTWTWNGTNWTSLSPAHNPGVRYNYGFAYDQTNSKAVLFGGLTSPTTNVAETWTWNGTDWTHESPAASPAARSGCAMGFDERSGLVVMFGGADGSTLYDDTWTWDGTNWTQLTPTNHPLTATPEFPAAAPLVWVRGRLVMETAVPSGGGYENHTWEWDGTDWTEIEFCDVSPVDLLQSGLAFDENLGKMVLFGGSAFDDTWAYPYVCAVAAYQRVYGWRANIDDNALETVTILTSPQGFTE